MNANVVDKVFLRKLVPAKLQKKMLRFEVRLATFDDFEPALEKGEMVRLVPYDCANNGFFFLSDGEMIVCSSCLLSISNFWTLPLSLLLVHGHFSPGCTFVSKIKGRMKLPENLDSIPFKGCIIIPRVKTVITSAYEAVHASFYGESRNVTTRPSSRASPALPHETTPTRDTGTDYSTRRSRTFTVNASEAGNVTTRSPSHASGVSVISGHVALTSTPVAGHAIKRGATQRIISSPLSKTPRAQSHAPSQANTPPRDSRANTPNGHRLMISGDDFLGTPEPTDDYSPRCDEEKFLSDAKSTSRRPSRRTTAQVSQFNFNASTDYSTPRHSIARSNVSRKRPSQQNYNADTDESRQTVRRSTRRTAGHSPTTSSRLYCELASPAGNDGETMRNVFKSPLMVSRMTDRPSKKSKKDVTLSAEKRVQEASETRTSRDTTKDVTATISTFDDAFETRSFVRRPSKDTTKDVTAADSTFDYEDVAFETRSFARRPSEDANKTVNDSITSFDAFETRSIVRRSKPTTNFEEVQSQQETNKDDSFIARSFEASQKKRKSRAKKEEQFHLRKMAALREWESNAWFQAACKRPYMRMPPVVFEPAW